MVVVVVVDVDVVVDVVVVVVVVDVDVEDVDVVAIFVCGVVFEMMNDDEEELFSIHLKGSRMSVSIYTQFMILSLSLINNVIYLILY